ncbi:heparan-alpha-glucosaminide N-acetyltransferase domain-containing protein [Maribacter sp.]|uniref:DUF1624 domain-containing protein n=1 Tax=Maribacter sp. TaxID=1897614 RepID=UPI0025B91C90|nr:heparan-alpha-glucosaminide N-acetyltransferase domain-containing protein [Maribacter sp.]
MIKSKRIISIDVLRGVIMVIMALDHVRAYFHYGSFFNDPTNLETTTPILFFTRFITHFCAPVFIFLAGTSAFLFGKNKSKSALFKFLFTRGVWLIFLEIVVNNLIWTFDITYSFVIFQVIWTIGFSMICLSFLMFLPKKIIFIIGAILIAGHNLLDSIMLEGQSLQSMVWYILHQNQAVVFNPNAMVYFMYPLLPWIGLMALGYLFGAFYQKDYDATIRKKWLLKIGLGALISFFILRGINIYGDLVPWNIQSTNTKTFLSFFNVTKYPPSLLFLCITMGPAILFLYVAENSNNKLTKFFLVFGRVPLYYYFLHMLVIHILAILGILIFGGNWHSMILTAENFMSHDLESYGYSLFIVYCVWISVILLLYPFCKKYMIYKQRNKNKWWLSYL